MQFVATDPASGFSRWTSRIALFAALMVLTAAFLHRLFGMPTLVAFTLFKAALLAALVALGLGIMASIGIWRYGKGGMARVVLGALISLALLSLPLVMLGMARDYPPINDVTTDTVNPPEFSELAKLRGPGANPATYPGDRFARAQAEHYPDLAPMHIDRSVTEAFEVVTDALRRQKLQLVREQSPGESGGSQGFIEAVDRTLVLGLYDDVSVRVSGDGTGARVDLRSASRYGARDLGQNADRLRAIMKEVVARLEETVPVSEEDRPGTKDKVLKPVSKRGKDGDRKSARLRKSRDPAQSDAQREPEPRTRPPATDDRRVRDRRPVQSLE
jgi:uncharacterized protein (DUF1499 family)